MMASPLRPNAQAADATSTPDGKSVLFRVTGGRVECSYVTIHAGQRTLVIRETLGSLARKLDPGTFARVHRS